MAGRPSTRIRTIVLVALLAWGVVLVGVAVAGLLVDGVAAPPNNCSGGSGCPEEESEGWIIAFGYAGTWVFVATGMVLPLEVIWRHHDRRPYVRGAVALLVMSTLLVRWTPQTWVPLRPAFAVGALGIGMCFALHRLLRDALRREAGAENAWLDGLRAAEAPADHGPDHGRDGGPDGGPDAASGHAPRDFGGGAVDN